MAVAHVCRDVQSPLINQNVPPKLILASGSPYRLELLQQAGIEAEAVPSHIPEPDLATFPDLAAGLIYLAQSKAHAVSPKHPSQVILAADSVSLVGNHLLGKPTDRADAERMLQSMSGIRHEVWTGWTLLAADRTFSVTGVDKTTIHFREWTPDDLAAYLDSGEWQGKCGAYGLRQPYDPMVESLQGSVSNVIGLPLEQIRSTLNRIPALFSLSEFSPIS